MRRATISRAACVRSIRLRLRSCESPSVLLHVRVCLPMERACVATRTAAREARDAANTDVFARSATQRAADRAARIVDHRGLEARRARIERGPCDAIVGREPATPHALRAELAQIAGEPRARRAVGFDERGIAVELGVAALADHEPGVRDVEI